VGCDVGLRTLVHTFFLPCDTHLKVVPLIFLLSPTLLQIAPAFTAPTAVDGERDVPMARIKSIAMLFAAEVSRVFMLYSSSRRRIVIAARD
jgi:hypothetical protein